MNSTFSLAHPDSRMTSIRVTVTHKGKRYRTAVGISIAPSIWSQDKQKCSDNAIQKRLQKVRHYLEDTLSELSTEAEIQFALLHIQHGDIDETLGENPVISFWQFYKEWSERPSVVKRQRQNMYKTTLRLMGSKENWAQIDMPYYMRLIKKLNEAKYSKNYQATIVAKLKAVMNEGYKLGYHTNTAFHDFKKPSAEVDSVYLTEEELEKIWATELYNTTELKCRDLLILGCYTGARWEDFSQFTTANIQDGQFRYIQRKTGARVIVPLSPKITAVLDRNGGKSPKLNSVSFNRIVKVVCERAGLTDMIEVRRSKGEFYEQECVPKFSLISSHCCRRTLCTLLAKKGVPIPSIMQVSGHKSLSSLQKYLRQSVSETASKLAELDYFQ